jgi:hypothetical protein
VQLGLAHACLVLARVMFWPINVFFAAIQVSMGIAVRWSAGLCGSMLWTSFNTFVCLLQETPPEASTGNIRKQAQEISRSKHRKYPEASTRNIRKQAQEITQTAQRDAPPPYGGTLQSTCAIQTNQSPKRQTPMNTNDNTTTQIWSRERILQNQLYERFV